MSCSNHGSRSSSHSSRESKAARRGGGCCTSHARSSSSSRVAAEDANCNGAALLLLPAREGTSTAVPVCSSQTWPAGRRPFFRRNTPSASSAARLSARSWRRSSGVSGVLRGIGRPTVGRRRRKGTRFAVAAEGRKYRVRCSPRLRNGLVYKLGVRFAKWLWPRPVCKIRPLTGGVCKLVRLKGCFAKQRPFCTFGLSTQTAPKCDRQKVPLQQSHGL